MTTKRRWILGCSITGLIALGVIVFGPRRMNDAALLTTGTKFRLIKMDDLVGRPFFEYSSGRQKWRFPPASNPGISILQPVDRPGAAAVIGGAGPEFTDFEWVVDGQPLKIDNPFNPFEGSEWIHVPYLFGNKSKEALLIPKPGHQELRVRLPSNGREAPKLPRIVRTVDRFRLTMEPLPILSPMAEPVYMVRVESAKGDEDVCVNIRVGTNSVEGTPSATYLQASPKAGIFRLNRWFDTKGRFTVQIIPMTKKNEYVRVSKKGSVVDLYFVDSGKLIASRYLGSSQVSSSGEIDPFEVRHNNIPLTLNSIDAEINTGFPPLNLDFEMRHRTFFENLRDGQTLSVTSYYMAKDFTIDIPVDLPRPSIFDL